jgi:hypothetical protein
MGVLMKSCSTRLFVLAGTLVALGATRAQARPPAVDHAAEQGSVAIASIVDARTGFSPPLRVVAASDATSEGQDTIAWDCVPNYWWGYWTWAWQPCAWIDRSYVEGTIGAVAELAPKEPASEASL